MRFHSAIFSESIFGADILLTFGSMDQMDNWYKRQNLQRDRIDRHLAAFTETVEVKRVDSKDNELLYHIHFDIYGFSTIVHEANHTTFDILNDRGITLSQETKEVFAYYESWVARNCRDYLEKWTKNRRKK